MDSTIKTIIELNNDSDLYNEFIDVIKSALPVFIPVMGSIIVGFFAVRITRRILRI